MEETGAHALFTNEDSYAPEVFARAGAEIYVAGMNDAALPLPDLATDAQIDDTVGRVLEKTAKRLLGVDDLDVVRRGLCFRPVTERGLPILAKFEDEQLGVSTRAGEGGVWVAVGHGPWGISNSLGTGKVMAEMIQGRPTSVDVGGLSM